MQLTILKHAIMKLDGLQTDLGELVEDEVTDEELNTINECLEMASLMEATLIKIVGNHTSPEEFLEESITAPELDEYPE